MRTALEQNRLTAGERSAMVDRLTATVAQWAHGANSRTYMVRPFDVETLRRAAVAAIGCDWRDLRSDESREICELVASMVGETYNSYGAPA